MTTKKNELKSLTQLSQEKFLFGAQAKINLLSISFMISIWNVKKKKQVIINEHAKRKIVFVLHIGFVGFFFSPDIFHRLQLTFN